MTNNVEPSSAKNNLRANDARAIALVGLAHFISHAFHLILIPLFPWLKTTFELTYSELAFLMTAFFLASGIIQVAAGFIIDKMEAWFILMIGISLLASSAIVLGLSQSYLFLLLGTILARIGNGVFHPADFTLLNHHVSQSRLPHAFSIHSVCGNLGWAAAPVFLIGITMAYDWRIALFAASVCAWLVFAVLLLFREQLLNRKKSVDSKDAAPIPAIKNTDTAARQTFNFLYLPQVWMCWAFLLVVTLASSGIQNFSPTLLGLIYDMSLTLSTTSYVLYMAGGVVGMIAGGWIATYTKRQEHIIAIAFLIASLAGFCVALGTFPVEFIPFLFICMGFAIGVAGPSRDMLIRSAAPPGAIGRVYGVVYSGLDIGLAIGPIMFGILMDAEHFKAVFILIAALQLLAIAIALMVPRNKGN